MAALRSPHIPQYRVTFFYGPEAQPGPPPATRCVFNVKKRSWKGGIQVAVDVEERQLRRAGAALQFEVWLQQALAGVSAAERPAYELRARDLLIQGICAMKLSLALEGLRQENCALGTDQLLAEVDRAVAQRGERLKTDILAELDLA
jgi:hypothetical protein